MLSLLHKLVLPGSPCGVLPLAFAADLVTLQVMKQLPVFRKLLQEAADGNEEGEDIAKGLARVFAEVGEAYVSLISAGKRPHIPQLPQDHWL